MNFVTRKAVTEVAGCDILFGCTDGAEARHVLNRLATFYSIPYFDVGIRLDADGPAESLIFPVPYTISSRGDRVC